MYIIITESQKILTFEENVSEDEAATCCVNCEILAGSINVRGLLFRGKPTPLSCLSPFNVSRVIILVGESLTVLIGLLDSSSFFFFGEVLLFGGIFRYCYNQIDISKMRKYIVVKLNKT